jgi:cyanate permease
VNTRYFSGFFSELRRRHYHWVMLALVWLLYTCFGMVTQSLAPLVTPVRADLGLSYTQIGTILGAWPLVYVMVAALAGSTMDRVGVRASLGIGILLVALSALLRGLANSFEMMFLAVAVFGLGGPMVSIGAPKVIALWFKGENRATAVGIYATGPQIGGVIALSTANSLLLPLTGSWRLTFICYGALVMIAAMIWWALARDREARNGTSNSRPSTFSGDVGRLVSVRNVQIILAIALVAFVSGHGLGGWLPKILQSGGMTPAEAGFWASLPALVGIAGALTIPRLAPAGQKRVVMALLLLGCSLASFALSLTTGVPMLLALVLQGVARSSVTPLLMLIMMDTVEVGPARMGAAGGLYFTVGELGGFAGPFLMGWLADLTGGFFTGLVFLGLANAIAVFLALTLREPEAIPPLASTV